ncbi:MAG TPA: hypothetical protein VLS48_04755 [Anaerolineales bacterium]|nr:hypothetical protein [Anaerolineales bacterium]
MKKWMIAALLALVVAAAGAGIYQRLTAAQAAEAPTSLPAAAAPALNGHAAPASDVAGAPAPAQQAEPEQPAAALPQGPAAVDSAPELNAAPAQQFGQAAGSGQTPGSSQNASRGQGGGRGRSASQPRAGTLDPNPEPGQNSARFSNTPNPQNGFTEWQTVTGTVSAFDTQTFMLTTADAQAIPVQLGNLNYVAQVGLTLSDGQQVSVTGFWETADSFAAGSLTLVDTGQTFVLRDDLGRPLWRGGQGQ